MQISRATYSDSHLRLCKTLNQLIETCKDSENGYRHMSFATNDNALRDFFNGCTAVHGDFASVLQRTVAHLGGREEYSGTLRGALRRSWTDVQSSLAAGDADKVWLAECERLGDDALLAYDNAIAMQLPADIRSILISQRRRIIAVHVEVRRLREDAPTGPSSVRGVRAG